MDIAERLERAMLTMESGLKAGVTLTEIAGEACFSPCHFHRVFTAVVGESPGSYMRRRRLTLAAEELLSGDRRVLDIALDWGFQTPESFSRAFVRQFGVTPGAYRRARERKHLLFRHPLTARDIHHRIKGDVTMKPQITDRNEIKLVGLTIRHTLSKPKFMKLWEDFMKRLPEIKNVAGKDLYEVCCCDTAVPVDGFNEETPYTVMAGAEVGGFDNLPKGMESRVIPAGKYAVFTHKGPMSTIKATYDYIYRTWLPASGCELRPADDFALYGPRFKSPESIENEVDICIPVK